MEKSVSCISYYRTRIMKRIKTIIILFALYCFTSLSAKVCATEQISDFLTFQGKTYRLYANPLELHPEIKRLKPKLFGTQEMDISTACWRGYIAHWEIVGGELYLTAIHGCDYPNDKIKANLTSLFGSKYINGRLKADWLTTDLIVPKGIVVPYIKASTISVTMPELYFRINNGNIEQVFLVDATKSKINWMYQPNSTMDFLHYDINWKTIPIPKRSVKIDIAFSADKDGKIDEIQIANEQKIDKRYQREAILAIKRLEPWDVIYMMGKHKRITSHYSITFSAENKKIFNRTW